jgi:hypothetical protein
MGSYPHTCRAALLTKMKVPSLPIEQITSKEEFNNFDTPWQEGVAIEEGFFNRVFIWQIGF